MKAIRIGAALLMILTAVLHFLPVHQGLGSSDKLFMIGFGVVYLTIGILLLLDNFLAQLLGIIFPAIGIWVGFVNVGLKHWSKVHYAMFIIDFLVIICCIVLLVGLLNARTEQKSVKRV